MTEGSDFREDAKFDKYELDTVAEEHAATYAKWAEEWIQAEDDFRTIERKLKRKESELYLYVMQNWDKAGFDKKPTEGGAANWINLHKEFQELEEQYYAIMKIRNPTKEAKTTLLQRKDMIEIEASLYTSQFWGKPEVGSKAQETIHSMRTNKHNQEISDKVAEAIERRLKRDNDY